MSDTEKNIKRKLNVAPGDQVLSTGNFNELINDGDLNGLGGVGSTVGAIGDSITSMASSAGATSQSWQSNGYAAWLRQKSRQSIILNPSNLYATSGYTTQQIITTHLPTALAAELDIYIVHCGTNDITASNPAITAATTIANIQNIVSQLLDTGAYVILTTILPRTGTTATVRQKMHAVNNAIIALAQTNPKIRLVHLHSYFVDSSNADGDPLSGLLYDGLHPGTIGAELMAELIWEQMYPIVKNVDIGFYNPADVYDSSINTLGSLITNGNMNGTAGTVSGTGNSGTAPDSWTFVNGTSSATRGDLTAVASVVAKAGSRVGRMLQVVFAGTPTSIYTYFFRPTASSGQITTGFSPGDTVYIEMMYEIDYGSTGLAQVGVELAANNGSSTTFTARDFVYISTANYNTYDGTKTYKGVAKSQPFVLPSDTTNIQPRISISFANGALSAATVRVGDIQLRKVI